MISQSPSASFDSSLLFCPSCKQFNPFPFSKRRKKRTTKWSFFSCSISNPPTTTTTTNNNNNNHTPNLKKENNILNIQLVDLLLANSTSKTTTRRGAKILGELEAAESESESQIQVPIQIPIGSNNFTNFQEDPIVDKLRTQLGVIHPIPSPPINRNILGLFVFFFFVGVVFDKVWTSRKTNKGTEERRGGAWPQVPTSFSLFLEKDLQRKESVEWVNMVLGKLWKVYRGGIENWLIGLLQPVIDNLKKPDYVERVEIKQFSLGDEPLSVRNVERRTSRRVNDLQ